MKIILFIWFTDKIKKKEEETSNWLQTETKLSPKSPKPQARNWGIGYSFLDPWGMANYHYPIPRIPKEWQLPRNWHPYVGLTEHWVTVPVLFTEKLLETPWNLFEPFETSHLPIFRKCYQKSGYWEVSRGFKRFFGKQEWHCEINQTLSYSAKVSCKNIMHQV